MSIFSLRKRFFGGVCEFPKFHYKSFLLFFPGVLLLSLSIPVSAVDSPAENPTTGTEVTPKTTKTPELSTYRLQVGDSFVVTVDGYPEYSKERIPVPVQQDGYVSYPLIGLIKATNLTVSELEAQMQSAFSKHLPTARVFVTLMQPKRTILVFGAVEPRPRGNFPYL